MKKTIILSEPVRYKKWYIIDANNQTLGRLSTKISTLLLGKKNRNYTPFLNMGPNIIILNVNKIVLSGKKEHTKLYKKYSRKPGNLKIENFSKIRQTNPEKILEYAIKGMLPKGPLGRKIFKKLKIYKGPTHPHQAQLPEMIV